MAFLGQINYSLARDESRPKYSPPPLGERRSQSGQGFSILNQNVTATVPIKEPPVLRSTQRVEPEPQEPVKFTHIAPSQLRNENTVRSKSHMTSATKLGQIHLTQVPTVEKKLETSASTKQVRFETKF